MKILNDPSISKTVVYALLDTKLFGPDSILQARAQEVCLAFIYVLQRLLSPKFTQSRDGGWGTFLRLVFQPWLHVRNSQGSLEYWGSSLTTHPYSLEVVSGQSIFFDHPGDSKMQPKLGPVAGRIEDKQGDSCRFPLLHGDEERNEPQAEVSLHSFLSGIVRPAYGLF